MNRHSVNSVMLVTAVVLLGLNLIVRASGPKTGANVRGYEFWRTMPDKMKLGYVYGYSDAEVFWEYGVLEDSLRPLCPADGIKQIDTWKTNFPVPMVPMSQVMEGIDAFYKDWRNRSVPLFYAREVALLELSGRPQKEIDEAARRGRKAGSE